MYQSKVWPNTRLLKVRFDAGEIPNHIAKVNWVLKLLILLDGSKRYINNRRN
jgi:hypothetical protein